LIAQTPVHKSVSLALTKDSSSTLRAVLAIQTAVLSIQKITSASTNGKLAALLRRQDAIDVLKAAAEIQKAAILIQESVLAEESLIERGDIESNGNKNFVPVPTVHHRSDPKYVGDVLVAEGRYDEAIKEYEKALEANPQSAELLNNLAVAQLSIEDYDAALRTLHLLFFGIHGVGGEPVKTFVEGALPLETQPQYASEFKLRDRIDQIGYLLENQLIHPSFATLEERYCSLLDRIRPVKNHSAYTPLNADQLKPFSGFFDKCLYFDDVQAIKGPAVNENLDFERLENDYLKSKAIHFDDLLSPDALDRLRKFFLCSMVFYRHSEAGFVGSYVTEGFACGLIFQIIKELKEKFPNLLTGLPLNNMWCYRYAPSGSGVKPHNGDGSVTFNFWLTPDESNLTPSGAGGLIMYDKEQPDAWDWLTFNMYKDDPGIQAQIAEYLKDAGSFVIPYGFNRAVLFHSTLFHKTDPFIFKDGYLNRRMNVTMLFGRRGQESATLK
jgi:tetratricopeptide (TPR) repeat protein